MNIGVWVSAWWSWVTAISWQLAIFVVLTMLATFLLRNARPGIRHTLWLLVLLKVLLPTSLSAPWSLSTWFEQPTYVLTISEKQDVGTAVVSEQDTILASASKDSEQEKVIRRALGLWSAGVFICGLWIGQQYIRLRRKTLAFPVADEGPARVALERAALSLGIAEPPELRVSHEDSSPFLIGTLRPSVVIPESFAELVSPDELETVLLHELVHWKKKDAWIGWVQVVIQCLMWFHPCVWLANAFVNHERETACDDEVLRCGRVEPEEYSEIILRVLKLTRGRSFVASGLVGVFERGGRIQSRLESIMKFDRQPKRSGVMSQGLVVAFAMTFLPMAPWQTEAAVTSAAGTQQPASTASMNPAKAPATPDEKNIPGHRTPYPAIVKITPTPGSTKIDPGVDEIRVTFDRDMGEGMSWTGGGPEFPVVDKARTAGWINKRTCVLPVTLKRGRYYRLGINSKSHLNFKSATGQPVPPTSIFFTTKGATSDQENKVLIPKIVNLSPADNAANVKPTTRSFRVTFNVPMGEGMSWTGGGEAFPEIPKGKRPSWSKDGRTCTLPVKLQSNHEYRIGLNSLSHNNFQSKWGVPLKPVVYSIKTAAD